MLTRRTLLVSTAAGLLRPWRFVGSAVSADLAIFHTNDLHGRVDVNGATQGLAYVAREIRRQRTLYPASLTFDAGDIIHGTPMEQRVGPRPVLEAMSALGYDCVTAGNHEFDFGPENLRNAARIAPFPILSANVTEPDGQPWSPLIPRKVFERGGKRVGVFGLTTLDTPKIQWPRTIDGIRFNNAYEAARRQIKALRDQCDLLICLSHLGYAEDRKLAHEAPGLDLIIGGHSHTRLDEAKVENGVPIVQTGAYGKAFGRLEVRFDGKRPRFEYLLIDAFGEKDAQVDATYHPRDLKLQSELSEPLATLANPLVFTELTKERNEVGQMLAEAVRAAHGTEVGLFSSSQIQGELAAGPVTRAHVYRVMAAYTRQHIVKMRVPSDLATREIAAAGPSVQVSGSGSLIAGPAHVMQDLFLGKPGVDILYDDPLGPNVRDAVMDGLKRGVVA